MKLNPKLLLNAVYPIGSIYMSVNSTDPSTLFGGTWEQLKDRFLLGSGDTYTNGATGGEATHTLTINEMPSHDHQSVWSRTGTSDAIGSFAGVSVSLSNSAMPGMTDSRTSYTGGSQAHNNMPPYLVVYMWKRVS